ncbi:MAG: hypothetical protein K7J15_02810 [Candidatus Regiella insecticola]|nr:hypothetical protein [Candidatus Regiella insecticola]
MSHIIDIKLIKKKETHNYCSYYYYYYYYYYESYKCSYLTRKFIV